VIGKIAFFLFSTGTHFIRNIFYDLGKPVGKEKWVYFSTAATDLMQKPHL